MQIIFLGFAIWLSGLSIVLVWIFRYFHRLSREVGKGDLVKLLKKVLDVQRDNAKTIRKIETEIRKIEDEARLHVQKVGLIRFNPFQEMGGRHSFSLVFLNNEDTGVVFTGLHSRGGTRVYVKPLYHGECELGLSDEERKALKIARRGKNAKR